VGVDGTDRIVTEEISAGPFEDLLHFNVQGPHRRSP
jgi:hypothetical protein